MGIMDKLSKLDAELETSRKDRQSLQESWKDIEESWKSIEERLKLVEKRTLHLIVQSEGSRRMRHQFLDLRDIVEPDLILDLKNSAADHGDAVADALLYQLGERDDENLLKDVYGVDSKEIARLSQHGRHDVIAVLNEYATITIRCEAAPPSTLSWVGAFNDFVRGVRRDLRANEIPSDPTDPKSSLAVKYNNYHDALELFKK